MAISLGGILHFQSLLTMEIGWWLILPFGKWWFPNIFHSYVNYERVHHEMSSWYKIIMHQEKICLCVSITRCTLVAETGNSHVSSFVAYWLSQTRVSFEMDIAFSHLALLWEYIQIQTLTCPAMMENGWSWEHLTSVGGVDTNNW